MNIDYQNNLQPTWPGLHVAAVVTACLMFPLIFLGGLVTSHQAGMSVPDWPNSYGYNMFLYPPKLWIGGIFYEHTHRLLGSAVGFSAVVLTLMAWAPGRSSTGRKWINIVLILGTVLNLGGTALMAVFPDRFHIPASARAGIWSQGLVTQAGAMLCIGVAWLCRSREPRRWVRWLCTASLVAICLQGLLGGLRVDLINLQLAIVHGCFAQASFCLIVLVIVVTGRWWSVAPDLSQSIADKKLLWLAGLSVGAVYCQLIVGALMRHYQAGLAVPDLPLAYGKVLPPTSASALAVVNHYRIWKLDLPAVTLGQVWLHMGHRLGAVVVSTFLLTLITTVFRRHRDRPDLIKPASVLLGLLVLQVTLGVLTVLWKKPADIASSHVACGALVLATTFYLFVRSLRLYADRSKVAARASSVSREWSPMLAVAGVATVE